MSNSLKGPTVQASFDVQPVALETKSERYFDNQIYCKKNGPLKINSTVRKFSTA